MLELQDLSVAYGHRVALQGISLTVAAGEIVTLVGGNGAGKSTTLKTISGLLRPSREPPLSRRWSGCWACSPSSRKGAIKKPARSRAASSRCWPLPAA